MSNKAEVSPAQPRRTVLVAEHDRAMRELLRVHLHNAGYSVILAQDAMVAGRTILKDPQKVDLLIVNAQLPFMSGIDFISTMIADSSLRYVPTILISTSDNDAGRAELLGVPCLIAPFSAQRLLGMVASTVKQPDVKPTTAGEQKPSMRQRLDDLTVPMEPIKPPLRIVIADDEADTVTSLMTILCHEGHSVFGSHHGTDVLPEVRMNKPDAVILDIDMPKVSGFAIARDIRELLGDRSPLLIAVSGKWVGQTDKMLAELAGFDHFMQKPCHPDALLALLEHARNKQQTREGFPCDATLSFLT